MHILYVDDSGTVADPNEHYFVLGAVSVFERGLFHQIKLADDCVASFGFGDPHEIELHVVLCTTDGMAYGAPCGIVRPVKN